MKKREFKTVIELLFTKGANPYIKYGENEYTILHYAIFHKQPEIVKIILEKYPDLINIGSKNKFTALHFAAEDGQIESLKYLLQSKADPTLRTLNDQTPYGLALSALQSNVISILLDYPDAASAIEYRVHDIIFSPFECVINNISGLSCSLALLAAGAGLNIDNIPKTLLDLLARTEKIEDRSDWEFVIIGEQNISDGKSKRLIVTKLKDFEFYINDPQCTFKINQIAISTQHQHVCYLEHVQKILMLIKAKSTEPLPLLTTNIPTKSNKIQISNLNLKDFNIAFELKIKQCISTTVGLRKNLPIFIQLKLIILNGVETFDRRITDRYFDDLRHIILFIQDPKFNTTKLMTELQYSFLDLYFELNTLLSKPQFKARTIQTLIYFVDNLENILNENSKILKEKTPVFYITLLYVKLMAMLKMTYAYLREDKLDLAQTLVSELLYAQTKSDKQLRLLGCNPSFLQAECNSLLAQIHIQENRISDAFEPLEKTFALLLTMNEVINNLSSSVSCLLLKHPIILRKRAIELLKTAIIYLEKLTPVKDDNKFNERLEKELTFLDQFKLTLTQYELEELVLSKPKPDPEPEPKPELKVAPSKPALKQKQKQEKSKPVNIKIKPKEIHNFGFDIPEDYYPPIPMQGGALSQNQLFITMPKANEQFKPFYKLIEGDTIKCVSPYSLGSQGVKLGKIKIKTEQGPSFLPMARLKVCGGETSRAWGFVEQNIKNPEGGIRKLYVFKPENIIDKKDEYRKGYKI